MKEATIIVAPKYQAIMLGVDAVQITASKVKLLDSMLKPIGEAGYRSGDKVGEMLFDQLVEFVRQAEKKLASLTERILWKMDDRCRLGYINHARGSYDWLVADARASRIRLRLRGVRITLKQAMA